MFIFYGIWCNRQNAGDMSSLACGPLKILCVYPIFVASLSEISGAEKEKKATAGRASVSVHRWILSENAELEEYNAYPGLAQSQHAASAWSIRLLADTQQYTVLGPH